MRWRMCEVTPAGFVGSEARQVGAAMERAQKNGVSRALEMAGATPAECESEPPM